MAQLKTRPTGESVEAFLNSVAIEKRRRDAFTLLEIFRKVTGEAPVMWGASIIGFGKTHYTYANGRHHDWFVVGFSPRKRNLALYLRTGFEGSADLLDNLG